VRRLTVLRLYPWHFIMDARVKPGHDAGMLHRR
jgi:hypothetical protein